MFRKMNFFALLFLTLFLYVEVAEAGLVRTSGRGVFSAVYDESFYFVENQHLNEVGITESAFSSLFSNSINRARGGGASGLDAVPDECTVGGTTIAEKEAIELDIENQYFIIKDEFDFGDIDAAERDARNQVQADRETALYGESCVWEFEQGEALSMFGFFGMYFGSAADINYDVNWNIEGKPTLSGEINLAEKIAPNGANIIREGWVTLDTVPSFDLDVGEYAVRTSVSLSSGTGKFFWESSKPGDEVEFGRKCIENPAWEPYQISFDAYQTYLFALEDFRNDPGTYPDPGPAPANPGPTAPDFEICGYNSISLNSDSVSSAPTSFYSEPELLRILAANSPPPNAPAVNAPASLGILLLGFGMLMLRRRVRR